MKTVFQNVKFGPFKKAKPILAAALIALTTAFSALVALPAIAAESEGTFVVIIGAPGSGKSTVSEYIRSSTGVPIIEVGQLLTEEIEGASSATAFGRPGSQRTRSAARRIRNIEQAKAQLETGELVESQALDAVIASSVFSPSAAGGFILDGYPGTWAQAEFLDGLLAARNIVPIVLYLDVTDEIALERMNARGRADDQAGFGQLRLDIFRDNLAPVLGFYQDGGLSTIDATQSISNVQTQVREALDNN